MKITSLAVNFCYGPNQDYFWSAKFYLCPNCLKIIVLFYKVLFTYTPQPLYNTIVWVQANFHVIGLGSSVGRVSTPRSGGTGFDPGPRHTKVVNNGLLPAWHSDFRGRARTGHSGVSTMWLGWYQVKVSWI